MDNGEPFDKLDELARVLVHSHAAKGYKPEFSPAAIIAFYEGHGMISLVEQQLKERMDGYWRNLKQSGQLGSRGSWRNRNQKRT
jgi:hypothetical protein